jgi:hypothetical protein
MEVLKHVSSYLIEMKEWLLIEDEPTKFMRNYWN